MRNRNRHQYSADRSITLIPCNRPYFGWSEFMAMIGPNSRRRDFEIQFANKLGARYGIAFPLGRYGIFAILKALKLKDTEVILPAYTCEAVAMAIVASGNRPVFIDIRLSDFNMDLDLMRQAFTSRTRAVIATHLYGYPTNVDYIKSCLGDQSIIIIEDCAQRIPGFGFGNTGSQGDFAIFSFGRGKPMCTVEGGLVTTNSNDFYEIIKAERNRMFNRCSRKMLAKRWVWFLASYIVYKKQAFGVLFRIRRNYRKMVRRPSDPYSSPKIKTPDAYTNFQASIGLAQLKKLDTMISGHRYIADLYDRELRKISGIIPAPRKNGCTYCTYTFRAPKRDEIHFKERMALRGVSVGQDYSYALPYLAPYKRFARGDYSGAATAAKEVVNLPCYPGLKESDIHYIATCVGNSIRN
jgi:dTDP-4-amino-4,6-dideoxygalactose transaminase